MAEEILTDKELKKKQKEERKSLKSARKEAIKKAKENGEEIDDESGAGPVVVVGILIAMVWIAILALLIKMDVGGFGSTVLYPVLKDVPYFNKILPESEDYAVEDSAYQFDTMEDAVNRIKELEGQLADATASSEFDSSHIAELEAQASELAVYKANEKNFEEIKEKFYEEVVFGDKAVDINEYKKYYESIEPQNAEIIYKQVVTKIENDEEIEDYAKAYSSMKPKQAAEIFNTMTDNLKLVGKILWAMDNKSRGDILGNMDPNIAADVTELMEP